MVTVFSKERCVQCDATKKVLKMEGIPFVEVSLEDNPDALNEVKSRGFKSAPVVNFRDVWFSGFQPELLKNLK